jgi:hypothetical protein
MDSHACNEPFHALSNAEKRFELGLHYLSPSQARRIAHVLEVRDEGAQAFVEIRTTEGFPVCSAWVDSEQFLRHWVPADPVRSAA